MDLDWVVWVVLAIVLLVVVGLVLMATRRKREAKLANRFGPEYDRTLGEAGNKREAHRHLKDVANRRDQLQIRELDEAEKGRYEKRWESVQMRFVDSPGTAVDDAEGLVSEVMQARGYPVDDFDTRADILSADHPQIVQKYRSAHEAHEGYRQGGPSATEHQRHAFTQYRDLFGDLVGTRYALSEGDKDEQDRDHEPGR